MVWLVGGLSVLVAWVCLFQGTSGNVRHTHTCSEVDLLKYWGLLIQHGVVPDEAHKLALTARYGKGYFTKPVKKFLEIYNPKLLYYNRTEPMEGGTGIQEFLASVSEIQTSREAAIKDGRPFKTICQTGFNAGVSALAFLCGSREHTVVRSFDLGEHSYTKQAESLINTLYPGRHQVTYGDSTLTLPVIIANGGLSCDFVFVDGGHTHAIAKADLLAFKKLSTPGTTIAVDNCNMWNAHHGNGGVPEVSTAYLDLVKEGLIYHHKQISVNDCFGKGSDLCREVCVGVYS